MSMRKLILIIPILFLASSLNAQFIKPGEARGLFMTLGTGPKVPIGTFSDTRNLGIGFDVALSYTDNKVLPVFVYAKLGFQHFPGKQALYKRSDYSSISSNVVTMQPGIRFFFPPLVTQDFILMPVVEGGLSWSYFMTLHQFKIDSNRNNYDQNENGLGFHIGGGFSMFLMDVMAYYNFILHHQYLSFDLRVRIPIFVKV